MFSNYLDDILYSDFRIKSQRSKFASSFFEEALCFPEIVSLSYDSGTGTHSPEYNAAVLSAHRNATPHLANGNERKWSRFVLSSAKDMA